MFYTAPRNSIEKLEVGTVPNRANYYACVSSVVGDGPCEKLGKLGLTRIRTSLGKNMGRKSYGPYEGHGLEGSELNLARPFILGSGFSFSEWVQLKLKSWIK